MDEIRQASQEDFDDKHADVAGVDEVVGKNDLNAQARVATDTEHSMTTWQALKAYPKAVMWGSLFTSGLIMVGYDSAILGNFYALPAFNEKYGHNYGGDAGYQVPAPWQVALGLGGPIGQLIGALATTFPLEKYGRKKTYGACLLITGALIFLEFFAKDIHMLAAGEFLVGIMYGTFLVIAPTYCSEVCPMALRGILNAAVNLGYVIGQFIASGIGDGFSTRTDQWAYRVPFALQWTWIFVLGIPLIWAPESPWWLVRQGRSEDAAAALRRLTSSTSQVDIQAMLALIETTTLHEAEVEKSTSYIECFRGTNKVRTEAAVVSQIFQGITGISFISYAVYFFEIAGLNVAESFGMGVGNTGLAFVATCSSWVLMAYFGRRTIFTFGVACMAFALMLIGILDVIPGYDSKPGLAWAQAGVMDLLTYVFQSCVGPLSFVIFAEVGATRLRAQTIALSAALSNVFQLIIAVGQPYMINPAYANMRGKLGFFYSGISIIATIWCYFRLPETKGRTQHELDIMFERKVPLRHFKGYQVEEEALELSGV